MAERKMGAAEAVIEKHRERAKRARCAVKGFPRGSFVNTPAPP